jgi:hypothetical protein
LSWLWWWGFLLSDAVDEGLGGCSALHAAALMRPFSIVLDNILVEQGLHLVDGLEPGLAALDPKVLVELGSVRDDAVRCGRLTRVR